MKERMAKNEEKLEKLAEEMDEKVKDLEK